jgi:hypothetical protein
MKTVSKAVAIPLGNNLDKIIGDYLIICCKAELEIPETYVYPINYAKKICVASNNKNGTKSYWINTKDYIKTENLNNWEKIGRGDS